MAKRLKDGWFPGVLAVLALMGGHAAAQDQGFYEHPSRMELPGDGLANYSEGGLYIREMTPDVAKRLQIEQRVRQLKQYDRDRHGKAPKGAYFTPQDIENLRKRAAQGDGKAMGLLGFAHEHGAGVKASEKQAVEWYKRAVQHGENRYNSTIGNLYRDYGEASRKKEVGFFGQIRNKIAGKDSEDVVKNNEVARQWYQRGTFFPNEDWRAFIQLGVMYRNGEGGLEKDPRQGQHLHNRGLDLRKRILEQEEKYQEQLYYEQARREIMGVDRLLTTDTKADRQAAARSQPAQTVSAQIAIAGAQCTYSRSGSVPNGYSQAFVADCPALRGQEVAVTTVGLVGLDCDLRRQGNLSGTFQLLCNVAQQYDMVRIGNANCRIEEEQAVAPYRSVYGLYCAGQAQEEMREVTYNDMTCAVTAEQSGGKTYTLRCGAPQEAGTAPAAAPGQQRSVRLGMHQCALQPLQSTDSRYTSVYEAYCGGLSQQEKTGASVPRSVAVGVQLCEAVAWADNDAGKDFELYCR